MDKIYLSILKQITMCKNLKELMVKFSNEDVCRQHLIQQRWNGKPECPYCGSGKHYIIENGKRFKCGNSECYKKYSVTVGTIFHASNIPLTTWFPAMYLISAHKKGISSVQLAKDLGVTQKTAWFMLHRIRESLKDKSSKLLTGTIESDETYMSRKYRSDYKGLSEKEVKAIESNPHSTMSKGAVVGLAQRGGDIKVIAFDRNTKENVQKALRENVEKGSTLYTDESNIYTNELAYEYNHWKVNHSKRQWTDGIVHTNTVETFWSVMKRGLYGIYHQVSFKHLQRYCDEFSYRYNSRDLADGTRFELGLKRISGKLPYKQLVHGKGGN